MKPSPLILTVVVVASVLKEIGSVKCYSCVYLPERDDSQGACSDPWPWYRESFGDMYKPPVRECPHGCMKVVIANRYGEDSVVRSCGLPCNETLSSTTITTCCQGDMCNHSNQLLIVPKMFLLMFLLIYIIV